MDSTKIKALIIIIVAMLAAIYLGVAAATAQVQAVAWIVGGLIITVSVALGNRIWLLIPLMSNLNFVLPLPGNFTSLFLAQFLIVSFLSTLFLLRQLPFEVKYTELEFLCLIFLLAVIQVYLRNPVGLNILGGETVGGKAYVIFAISFSTAALISILRIDPNDLKWWVRLSILGMLGNFGLGAVLKLFPTLSFVFGASFATDIQEKTPTEDGNASRVSFVRGLSETLAIWISSKISPIRACLHPFYGTLILISISLAMISGFRVQLIGVGLFLLLGIAYRGGIWSLIISLFLGMLGVTFLAIINIIMPLPANMQRSLTFLPGTWEERYKDDAEGSTEWRVIMWKEALFTDKWIANKWLGDGLGFKKAELDAIESANLIKGEQRTTSGLSSSQENFMISGGYHSGPVVTVRTVGYVGLFILLFGFVRMMVHAHHQIIRSRNTEWYTPVMFICIPIIAGPLSWTFLYGSFEGGAAVLVMGCAMVRILERNLPLPARASSTRQPPLIVNTRHHLASS